MPTPCSAPVARRCSARRSRAAMRGCSRPAPTIACTSRIARVHAPHLAEIRASLPDGALGATLSGSGPTVIVWAEKARAGDVAVAARRPLPEHEVMHLAIATTGAGPA